MKRSNWLSLAVLGLLAAVLTGCPSKEFKVGVVVPASGDAEIYGQAVQNGVELAIEQLNADAAYETPIVARFYDTGSDATTAAEKLREAYGDGAIAVIGGITSGEAREMLPVVDGGNKVLLSPSASSPELTGASRNFYRIWPSDFTAAGKMAQAAATGLGVKTMVIIAEEQPYAKGMQGVLAPAFENLDGEVLEVIEFPPNTTDLDALVERGVSLNPDAIYLAAYADGIGSMILALRSAGYTGKILTTSAFATSSAIARVGEAAAGVYLTQTVFQTDSDFAHVQKFVNSYQEKFGELPDIYAAHGYDALMVLAEAVNGRATLPAEVKDGLRDDINEFPGVTGSIQFDDKGDVRKFPRVYIITEDLALVDYDEMAQRKREEIRRKQEELRRRLEQLGS
ncbi:MAG: branched-chain amino acid ABC transporter substrate-binding protein [Acidobacteriota bacterium]